jgi:hypothetical protein
MPLGLGLGLDVDLALQGPPIEAEVRERLKTSFVHEVGFVAAWKIQSSLATVAFIAFVALIHLGFALMIMMAWSLLATLIYHRARLMGLPDLFENSRVTTSGGKGWYMRAITTVLTLAKAFVVGVQPFIYCRTVGCLLRPAGSLPARAVRSAVLWAGLTLFGVTATHHLLSKAGYSGGRLLNLSYVGTALNVPYRMLVSAVLVNAFAGIISF